jgi:hypothetical protein
MAGCGRTRRSRDELQPLGNATHSQFGLSRRDVLLRVCGLTQSISSRRHLYHDPLCFVTLTSDQS